MAYSEAKVYSDGSHYIAIPKTTNPSAKKNNRFKDSETDEKKKPPTSCRGQFIEKTKRKSNHSAI